MNEPKIFQIRGEWLLISCFYLLVGLYATYPLINHFTQAIPYVFLPEGRAELLPLVSGDHLQTYYWFWLFKDNVLGASPLFSNPYEFNVGGTHIPHGYAQFPVSILFLILSVFGNVPAHNLLILLTYILSGMALYSLLRLWGISRFPALAGGLIFCLAPSRQTQLLSGHINGYVWFLIPLTLYWFEKGFQAKRYGTIVLSGLCILALGLVEPHLLYFFLLFLGFYLPARILGPWLAGQETEYPAEDSSGPLWPLLLVLALGILAGFAVYQTRGAFHQEKAFGLIGAFTLGFYALLFYITWMIGSRIIFILTGRPLPEIRQKEALSYLPFLLLLLIPYPFLFPFPHLRKALLVLILMVFILLKVRFYRGGPWSFRPGTVTQLPWGSMVRMIMVFILFIALAGGYSVINKKNLVGESIVGQGRTWQEVILYSPELHQIFNRANTAAESFIYPGLVSAALWLFLLGTFFFRPFSWDRRNQFRFWFFTFVLVTSYAIAFGPYFDPILPVYRLLYNYVPFFKYPRDPARIIFLSFLCWGIIAAFGLERLGQTRPGRPPKKWIRPVAALGLSAFVIFWDYRPHPRIGLSLLDEKNPVYRTIGGMPKNKALLLGLPLFPGDSHQSSLYEYYITLSRAGMVNGYSPVVARRYVEKVFWPLLDLNVGEITPQQYDLLQKLRVTHLVHHQELYFYKVSPFSGYLAFKNLKSSPYLKLVMTHQGQSLFEVLPAEQTADRLPAHYREPTGIVLEIEEMRRQGGRVVEDPEASLKKAVETIQNVDRPGKIAFNAFRFFPSGKYQVALRAKAFPNNSPAPVLLLDVVTYRDKKTVAQMEIRGSDFSQSGGYQRFHLPFEITRPEILEFRLLSFGRGTIRADKMVISFADTRQNPMIYEPLGFSRYLAKPVQDPQAVQGWALLTDPQIEHPGYCVFGPYQTFPAGAYLAHFRLKVSDRTPGPVVRLDVSAQRGQIVFNQKEISGGDFRAAGQYQEFSLPFTLKEEEELEFRLYTHNRLPFYIDRIVVERTP